MAIQATVARANTETVVAQPAFPAIPSPVISPIIVSPRADSPPTHLAEPPTVVVNSPPVISPPIWTPPTSSPPAHLAYAAPSTPSYGRSQSQGSIAGHIPPANQLQLEVSVPDADQSSHPPSPSSHKHTTESSQQDPPDSLHPSEQSSVQASSNQRKEPSPSGSEYVPEEDADGTDNSDEDTEGLDQSLLDDEDLLDDSIWGEARNEQSHNEEESDIAMEDDAESVAGSQEPEREEQESDQEQEDDQEQEQEENDDIEHEEHLRDIQQALAPNIDRPNSATSASTTYSEDIMREVRMRERAEAGLLDLGREGLTLEASEDEFNEFEKKLLNLQKQFTVWHRDSLAYDNQRIDVVIRVAKEHAAQWIRKNRGGGGGGAGREDNRVRSTLDEDEEQEFQALIDISRLTMEQRICRCLSAQELIDDLERCPPIPVPHELNLVEALVAIGARSKWLSSYFRLISTKRAVAWLQMRGPLATNLINIWTWKLEYELDVTIDHVQDVNIAFGRNWCILELLRRVENGEEGSAAERYTIDLYSTKYLKQCKALTRPRPLLHSAGLPRVSAWMTATRFHYKDTLAHRNLFDSPPTHVFAAIMLDNMSYAAKWHIEHDLEDWPIPMDGWPEALLTELKHAVAGVQRPLDPFLDEDLADFQAGGRKVSSQEIYDGILVHTQHILQHHDKKLQKVHERHRGDRKSRRKPVGNIMPQTLRAPPPNLEVEYIPPIDVCREAGTTLIKKVLGHPFWTLFGANMCFRCRNRDAVPRQGIHRSCYGADGAACVECQDSNQKCLMRLAGARIKKISSKDWRPKRPRKGVITGPEIAAALDNAWFDGKANEDTAPVEEWEELNDEYWLDMDKLETEEKRKRKLVDSKREAEQAKQKRQADRQAKASRKRKRDEQE
ncbi:hypothetical protein CALCODRAFT_483923 [Calocera cornea HHB12733]|uniref:Putative Zn2Cys6 domain-containing protein n=1 Tax=Calocera cornea HHB12733 TaxID=1353952 RepID=A0A165F9Y2_9BASI|nr:hypothetical protein CALCODRAFT_483923 [Calocera cornea HHB12733]